MSMDMEKDLSVELIDILGKRDASPIEKKLQALIKVALLSDNVLLYIREVQSALNGFGRVRSETVKGLVEYAMAYNEVQIRNTIPVDQQDKDVELVKYRLTQAEILLLGALAHLGLLE